MCVVLMKSIVEIPDLHIYVETKDKSLVSYKTAKILPYVVRYSTQIR